MPHHKLDLLAFGAHPDDVEISAGGTIIKAVGQGYQVGIIDLTSGELGSRGSAELRGLESANASKALGIAIRENLRMPDGFFAHDQHNMLEVVRMIRKYQPDIVLCTAHDDRHPDHGRSSKMIRDACFYSGLIKIETKEGTNVQEHWRPRAVYQYIQDRYLKPDFVVDVADIWEQKIEVLKCYSSQFYSANSEEPATPISGSEFFSFLKGRARQMARPAGLILAEGFIAERTPGIDDIMQLR